MCSERRKPLSRGGDGGRPGRNDNRLVLLCRCRGRSSSVDSHRRGHRRSSSRHPVLRRMHRHIPTLRLCWILYVGDLGHHLRTHAVHRGREWSLRVLREITIRHLHHWVRKSLGMSENVRPITGMGLGRVSSFLQLAVCPYRHLDLVLKVSSQLVLEVVRKTQRYPHPHPDQVVVVILPIQQGVVVVLFLVHFLVHDILFGNPESPTGASLMDLGSSTSRLDSSFETTITSSRCSNVGTDSSSQSSSPQIVDEREGVDEPLLVLLVGAFRLDRLRRTSPCQWRRPLA